MSHTLDSFALSLKATLSDNPGPAGRELVRLLLERALKDQTFLDSVLPPSRDQEREVIYEDADLGFCICVHVYSDAKTSDPHDHGPTWAIYGQAEGETEMSDWHVVTPQTGDTPAQVRLDRTYRLTPGDAHLYEIGDIHSPRRDAPTKLVRIEGQDTKTITRTPIAIDQQA